MDVGGKIKNSKGGVNGGLDERGRARGTKRTCGGERWRKLNGRRGGIRTESHVRKGKKFKKEKALGRKPNAEKKDWEI